MTSKSRSSRREAARQRERSASGAKWLLPAAGLVIAAVAVIAIVLSQGGSGSSASAAPTVLTGPPTITGTALPKFSQTLGDTAKGLAAPVVAGHDYSGSPVGIAPNGKPTFVIFAAHWCPHCQREIPLIQAWIDKGGQPSDVNLVSVSTGIDPTAPNYPPADWFKQVGWTVPIIDDPTNTVANAYGLSGYPFFVLLDGKGNVAARMSGEIPINDIESLLAAVPRS